MKDLDFSVSCSDNSNLSTTVSSDNVQLTVSYGDKFDVSFQYYRANSVNRN